MTTQQEYDTLKDMFLSDGWKLFLGYLEGDADVLANCRYLKSEQELMFTRGKLAILDDLINFEAKLDAAMANEDEASE
jgi:hypothetical protein